MDTNCRGSRRSLEEISFLSCSLLTDNPLRTSFYDQVHMEHLAQSIKENGLMEPLLVWKKEDNGVKYQILSGHYRLRACRRLRMKTVPCQLWEGDEEGAFRLYCSASLCSRTLDPLEQAYIILKLQERGKTLAQIGSLMGHTKSWACKRLKLLTSLDPALARRLGEGTIRPRLAQELTKLPMDNEEQSRVLRILERERMTKDDASVFINWWQNATQKEREEREKKETIDALQREEMHLSRMLRCATNTIKNVEGYIRKSSIQATSWPSGDWTELYRTVHQLAAIVREIKSP